MKATAQRLQERHCHEVEIRDFRFAAATATNGGAFAGAPTPQELLAASLAACSTLSMEAYAERKGWDIGEVAVEVDYEVAQRGCPARCATVVRLSEHLSEEQRRRLMSVAAKSPVHRTLEGETMFDERLEPTRPEAADGNGHRAGRLPDSNWSLRRFLRPYRRPTEEREILATRKERA